MSQLRPSRQTGDVVQAVTANRQSDERAARGGRRYLLLAMFVLAAALLGCATITHVVEVVQNADGTDGGIFEFELVFDPEFHAYLQKQNPDTFSNDLPASREQDGWFFEQEETGRIIRLRKEFASVEGLENAPAELKAVLESEDDGIVRQIDAEVTELDDGSLQYELTLVVDLPEDQLDEPAGEESSEGGNAGGIGDLLELDEESDPELEALLEELEAPRFVFEVRLPGQAESSYINGAVGGQVIAPNVVRWEFNDLESGTFTLQAFSTVGGIDVQSDGQTDGAETTTPQVEPEPTLSAEQASKEVIATLLAGLASYEERDARLTLAVAFAVPLSELNGKQRAREISARVLATTGGLGPYSDQMVDAAGQVGIAAYRSQLRDVNGNRLFPMLEVAMPVIAQLGIAAGEDAAAYSALVNFVEMLTAQDLTRLGIP